MGLYDDIYCEEKLPLPDDVGELERKDIDWGNEPFQTKDLESSLFLYRIKKGGKLILECHDREWAKDSSNFLGGYLRSTRKWEEEIFHHGLVRFYTSLYGDNHDYWIEFEAEFTKGELSNIKLIRFEEECNRGRIEANEKFKLELEKSKARQKKLWYKAYKWLWATPVWFVFGKLRWLFRTLDSTILKIQRKLVPF
tara:strand:+ start:30961 stop:31548 length:588 start_codon:yes stop_codon:yes gene_type:complete